MSLARLTQTDAFRAADARLADQLAQIVVRHVLRQMERARRHRPARRSCTLEVIRIEISQPDRDAPAADVDTDLALEA